MPSTSSPATVRPAASRLAAVRFAGATAVLLGLATAGLAVANTAEATGPSAPTFEFKKVGTVVVTGTVSDSLHYTVYRIENQNCTGTTFGDDCVPQSATGNINIPAGTYDHKKFVVSSVPNCGPVQQDVYNGAYQPKITSSGTHQFEAGEIVQLRSCGSPPTTPSNTPSPSGSTTPPTSPPTSSSPSDTPSTSTPSPTDSSTAPTDTTTPSTPATTSPVPTPAATTSTPTQPVATPDGTSTPFVPTGGVSGGTTMNQMPSGGIDAEFATNSSTPVAGSINGGYSGGSNSSGQLASTGVPTEVLGTAAGIAVLLGGGLMFTGRRRAARTH